MNKKETKFIDEILTFLIWPSFLVIGVSLFCLAGITFAWFNSSVQTNSQNLVAANFDVTMIIKKADGTIIDNIGKTYTLETGEYEITIKRSGTSQDSVGYANVKIGENYYNTESLNKDNDLIFQVYTDTTLNIEVKPVWGTYGIDDGNVLTSNTRIENITQPVIEESITNEIEEQGTQPIVEEDSSAQIEEQKIETNTDSQN